MSISETLLDQIRDRFAQIDTCPFQGPRVFFENAGGALTLKAAVETSARFAAIPDNQGRDNPAAHALMRIIAAAKQDMSDFFNASADGFFVGESGTELLFRLIRSAMVAAPGGKVLGSSIEHPATRSACHHWAGVLDRDYVCVPHDPVTGLVTAEAYRDYLTPDVTVATILHTSPVTGMGIDVEGIARTIRQVNPDCFIIVDGIQHACHGGIDISAYDIDGYVVSPYKVFSRHGYGVAWVSERLKYVRHERLQNAPEGGWELGTRDTGAYATFSDVVDYFDWLGGECGGGPDRRARILAAGQAIHAQEQALTDAMLYGAGNNAGLAGIEGITIIGGADNPAREGLVSFAHDTIPAAEIVAALNDRGIRTHTRKADHYSGNVLDPLGLDACVRVSVCHYNTTAEVSRLLEAMRDILAR